MRFALSAALAVALGAPAWAAPVTTLVHDPYSGLLLGEAHPSAILVQFKPSATDAGREVSHAAIGAIEARNLGAPGLYEIRLPPGISPDLALVHYSADPTVQGAYPNYIYHLSKTPSDPLVPQQYALSQLNAFGAWEYETGSSSAVTVAVMDTGVEKTHPDLAGKYDVARSRVFCPGAVPGCSDNTCVGTNDADTIGHGTEVAGIAAGQGNNGIGIAGIDWEAKIVSIKVFNNGGCSDDATIAAALNYAATLSTTTGRRTVVNMSLGSCPTPGNQTTCGACDAAVITAVNAAVAAAPNAILVAAAGNQSLSNPFKNVECPAKIPGVIPVGATDINQNIASFSAQGPELAAHGLLAPGVGVESTAIGASYTGGATGTSFSSPNVAGLAALILSAKPAFTQAQIESTLRNSAVLVGPGSLSLVAPSASSQGAGRADAFLAARLAVNGTLADFQGKQKAIAFPNPFKLSESGTVTITVPDDLAGANTKITIYTLSGRLVRKLNGQTWDGKNDGGVFVASGTYMFLVSTDRGKSTGRVALIR